mmetsp:Transcript_7954/g.33466  ORF Transcript_7954/g.33466 Transcript_7954/m.33466 type:complete len:717 (+) Transcript_7954:51-2201(+)
MENGRDTKAADGSNASGPASGRGVTFVGETAQSPPPATATAAAHPQVTVAHPQMTAVHPEMAAAPQVQQQYSGGYLPQPGQVPALYQLPPNLSSLPAEEQLQLLQWQLYQHQQLQMQMAYLQQQQQQAQAQGRPLSATAPGALSMSGAWAGPQIAQGTISPPVPGPETEIGGEIAAADALEATEAKGHIVIERRRADSRAAGGPLELEASFVHMVGTGGELGHYVYAAVTATGAESRPEEAIVAKDLVLLMDISKSMIAIMEKVKKAISFLVQEYCTELFRVGLVVFDDDASIAFNVAPMTPDNKKRLLEAIETALVPRGRTSIGLGLHRAFQALEDAERGAEGRSRSILLFTDGIDNSGDTPEEIFARVEKENARLASTIEPIACGKAHMRLLRPLHERYSSKPFFYLSGNSFDPDDIGKALFFCGYMVTSNVATNVHLVLELLPTVANKSVWITEADSTSEFVEVDADQEFLELELGDVHVGQTREFRIGLRVKEVLLERGSRMPDIATLSVRYDGADGTSKALHTNIAYKRKAELRKTRKTVNLSIQKGTQHAIARVSGYMSSAGSEAAFAAQVGRSKEHIQETIAAMQKLAANNALAEDPRVMEQLQVLGDVLRHVDMKLSMATFDRKAVRDLNATLYAILSSYQKAAPNAPGVFPAEQKDLFVDESMQEGLSKFESWLQHMLHILRTTDVESLTRQQPAIAELRSHFAQTQ